jgi:hypothetical protein
LSRQHGLALEQQQPIQLVKRIKDQAMWNTQALKSTVLYFAVFMTAIFGFTFSIFSQELIDDSISTSATRELDLKFINAELELAKANLDFVLEKNNKSTGSYSLIFIEELRLRIELHEEWGKQLRSEDPQFIPIDIQKAKGELKIAQMRHDADKNLRAVKRSFVSEGQINRSRLAVEAAKAWLDKVSHPSYARQPRDERIQWRFVILGKGFLEMRLERQR